MNHKKSRNTDNTRKSGREMYKLIERLYPITRSLTGNGNRETLAAVSEIIPLQIREIPTGTQVFDWQVPKEWNIKDAWIKNSKGEKIIDFQKSNLHVLNYSIPVNKKVSLEELKEHLFTLPEQPDWIPYRTSYHNPQWGFCMAHKQFERLPDESYEVMIDASLEPGSLTFGEYFIEGELTDEVLISTHICHPSLANDNLSGIAVSAFLAAQIGQSKPRYSYRFLFIPGTIGSITWLALNEEKVSHIKHGLVLNLLGDASNFYYKKSRQGNAAVDQILEHVLKTTFKDYGIIDFYPYGYDERQYCSPGFNLPVGRLSRKPHGEFPEYHTSADNLDFVKAEKLSESLELLSKVVSVIENNKTYLNLNPKCEPQLGKRGLFKKIGGQRETKDYQMALLWVLNLSDGHHSLLDIAVKSKMDFDSIKAAADALLEVNLLSEKR
jgi:aminopeptidase-like protein